MTLHCRNRAILRSMTAALLAGSSSLLFSVAAQAANFTADSHATLVAAIANANASADASSTITLLSSFTVDGTLIPAITKSLTIDTGGFVLDSASETWNVAAGATLNIEGALNTGGSMSKQGAGVVVLDGAAATVGRGIDIQAGIFRLDGGSQVSVVAPTGVSPLAINGDGALILSGSNTKLTTRSSSHTTMTGSSSLTIEDGAAFSDVVTGVMRGLTMDFSGTAPGLLVVTGAGSRLDTSAISIRTGTGIINVTAGGAISTTHAAAGGLANLSGGSRNTGIGAILVSGSGSRWDNSGTFGMMAGTLDVTAGGVLSTGWFIAGGAPGKTSTISVTGQGSRLVASAAYEIEVGQLGTSVLTVGQGAEVSVAQGDRLIKLGAKNTGDGTLNIGGASGEAAQAAGTIDAGAVTFGLGRGTLNFNHTAAAYDFDLTLSSNAAGTASINQVGSGKTILGADSSAFLGQTNVRAGVLEVNGSLGGTMDVFGGRLQGIGTVGTTTNRVGGTIAPGNSIGTLTVNGDYVSAGGALEIEAVLGDDSSLSDLLVITGDSLLGDAPTEVRVINLGGVGAETINGIKIVDVQGALSEAGVFVLNGPAIGGAYVYELFQNGLTVDPLTDGDWFLRNTEILAPTVPTLENYPVALLGTINLPTLRQRVGDRSEAAEGIFTRIEAAAGHFEATGSTTGASYDSSLLLAQIGLEGTLQADAAGSLTAGFTAQYGRSAAEVFSAFGDGANTTDSLGLGATLTWRGTDGTYADLQGQLAGFSTDLDAAGYRLVEDNGGSGFAVSLEVGHKIVLDDAWAITPQGQLSYAAVDFDSFTDYFGSEVSLESADSLVGRLGMALDYAADWQDDEGRAAQSKLYGIASLTYEFLDGARVVVSATDLAYSGQKFGAELGLGGQIEWADGAQVLHGEVLASSSFDGSYSARGTLGFTGRL